MHMVSFDQTGSCSFFLQQFLSPLYRSFGFYETPPDPYNLIGGTPFIEMKWHA